MKFLLVLSCLFFVSNAQIISPGPCPTLDLVQNFDLDAYIGVWYEIYRYETIFQLNGDCSTANYTKANASTINVFNRGVRNATEFTAVGSASIDPTAAPGEAKLQVIFPDSSSRKSPYWVLDTDYTDFTFVYSCEQLPGPTKAVLSWIMSRSKTVSPQAILRVDKIIQKVDSLSWASYRQTIQTEAACRTNDIFDFKNE